MILDGCGPEWVGLWDKVCPMDGLTQDTCSTEKTHLQGHPWEVIILPATPESLNCLSVL